MAVHCRLSTLLGAKRMKMTDLVRETGISKTTIHGLYHDKITKVSYGVVGKICDALDCTVGDLLVYAPDDEDSN